MKGVEGIEDIFGKGSLDKATTSVVHADGNVLKAIEVTTMGQVPGNLRNQGKHQ